MVAGHKSTGSKRAKANRRIQPHAWLGAGALALGVGAAALAGGSGVAHADDAGSDNHSSSVGHTGRPASSAGHRPAPKSITHPPSAVTTSESKAPASVISASRQVLTQPKGTRTPISPADAPSVSVAPKTVATAIDEAATGLLGQLENGFRVLATGVSQLASASGVTGQVPLTGLREIQQQQADAEYNVTVGWTPVLGTLYNGRRLVSDFREFTAAAGKGDLVDMADEFGDMVIDGIGMIPVVGAPLAAYARWFVAPEVFKIFPIDDIDTPDIVLPQDSTEQLSSTPTALATALATTYPQAYQDVYTSAFSYPQGFTRTENVLLNDVGRGTKKLIYLQPALVGKYSATSAGWVSNTPPGGFYGRTEFSLYQMTDSTGVTGGTTVAFFTVPPYTSRRAPVGNVDNYTSYRNRQVILNVVANDVTGSGGAKVVLKADTTSVMGGRVTYNYSQGTVTYTPPLNYRGTDMFRYVLSDGPSYGGISVTPVFITVQ